MLKKIDEEFSLYSQRMRARIRQQIEHEEKKLHKIQNGTEPQARLPGPLRE